MTANEDKIHTNRINVVVPLEDSIRIERESDKRGINRTQFIKEAIREKLQREEHFSDRFFTEIESIKKEVLSLKDLLIILCK
ncbi:hypothetical protein [Candidatus Odyssella acanthamoebae]|uniref:Uncharacterized protein n=1 Tax=Candidatus Odyssella acanthamoebae TaxID=91604 RepID=A0A077B020_9PROT|nr:hypothetical protein [Candidatus Paracaedibacter acanthamoebae]AIK97303.1 hypothetical protein ID47_12005 [Candidatus Paracaedibacter acanthamoebae]